MSPTCNRGSLADDTLTNSFALCPEVQTHWLGVFNLIPWIRRVSSECCLVFPSLGWHILSSSPFFFSYTEEKTKLSGPVLLISSLFIKISADLTGQYQSDNLIMLSHHHVAVFTYFPLRSVFSQAIFICMPPAGSTSLPVRQPPQSIIHQHRQCQDSVGDFLSCLLGADG